MSKFRCKLCNDIVESTHVHDAKRCHCGAIFVDGGDEYHHLGWPEGKMEDYIEDLNDDKANT